MEEEKAGLEESNLLLLLLLPILAAVLTSTRALLFHRKKVDRLARSGGSTFLWLEIQLTFLLHRCGRKKRGNGQRKSGGTKARVREGGRSEKGGGEMKENCLTSLLRV